MKMKLILIKLTVLFALTITMALGDEKIYKDVPNVSQAKDLNNDRFCGPVAAMNTLLWLRNTKGLNLLKGINNDDKILSFVNILGSRRYMSTSIQNGTSMSSLYGGLSTYIGECGYKIATMEMRSNSIRKDADPTCSFEWVRQMIDEDKCVILAVNWYGINKEPGNLVYKDGHFLTCIGYSVVGEKRELIFNDSMNALPAQRYVVSMVESGSKMDGKVVDEKAKGAPMRLDGYKNQQGHTAIIHNVLAYTVK